MLSAATVGLV